MEALRQYPSLLSVKDSATTKFPAQRVKINNLKKKIQASIFEVGGRNKANDFQVDSASELLVPTRRQAVIGLSSLIFTLSGSGGVAFARSRTEGRISVQERLVSIAETSKHVPSSTEAAPLVDAAEPEPQSTQILEAEATTLEPEELATEEIAPEIEAFQPAEPEEKGPVSLEADPVQEDSSSAVTLEEEIVVPEQSALEASPVQPEIEPDISAEAQVEAVEVAEAQVEAVEVADAQVEAVEVAEAQVSDEEVSPEAEASAEPVSPVLEEVVTKVAEAEPVPPSAEVGVAVGVLSVAAFASYLGRKLLFGESSVSETLVPAVPTPSPAPAPAPALALSQEPKTEQGPDPAASRKSSTDFPPAPRPLSPFALYPDLKPPVSPTPKAPSVAAPASASPAAARSSTDFPPAPRPLSPYAMFPDLKPPASPTPNKP